MVDRGELAAGGKKRKGEMKGIVDYRVLEIGSRYPDLDGRQLSAITTRFCGLDTATNHL